MKEPPVKLLSVYLLLYFTGTLLMQVMYRSLDNLARGKPSQWPTILIEQRIGVYGTAALLPLMLWGFRRYPFGRQPVRWLQHALLLLAFSVLHTSWNWGTRLLLFKVCAMGNLRLRKDAAALSMELPAEVITYATAAGCYLVYQRWARAHELDKELAVARLDAPCPAAPAALPFQGPEYRLQSHV